MIVLNYKPYSVNRFFNFLEQNWWGPVLVFVLPFFVMLAPELVGRQIFAGSDIILYHYSTLTFIKHWLVTGGSLFWSSQVFSGFPTFVLGVFFNPFFLPLKFLSVFTAYHWLLFFNLTAASFLLYHLLRRLEASFWPAVLGGLVYPFSLWLWTNDVGLTGALPLLPLVFILLHALSKKITALKIFGLAATVAYGVYAVNFNLLPIILATGFFYAVYLGFQNRSDASQKFWHLPALFTLAVVFGLALGWPQIAGTLKFTALSARAAGFSFAAASEGAVEWLDFSKLILPYAKLPVFFSSNYLYLGVLAPLLLILFLFRPKSPMEKFFWALFLFGLLMAVKYSPVFWLVSKLPFLGSLRVPGRWLFTAFFAASMLSAFHLDGLVKAGAQAITERFLKIYRWFIIIVLAFLSVSTIVLLGFQGLIIKRLQDYFRVHLYFATSQLPLEHYYGVISQIFSNTTNSISLISLQVVVPVGFLLLFYLLFRSFKRQKITSSTFAKWAVFVTALNFILVLFPFHSFVSASLIQQTPDLAQFMQSRPGKYFTFMPGFTEYEKLTVPHSPTASDAVVFQIGMLAPNASFYYGLSSADYYHNLQSRRMVRLLALIGSDRATTGEKLSEEKIPLEQKLALFEQRKYLLNLLGIRYVISGYPLDEKSFVKMSEDTITSFQVPIYLYENPEARPAVYLAAGAKVLKESEEASYKEVVNTHLYRRDIIVECDAGCSPTSGEATGEATVLEQADGKWKIGVDTPQDRWLVVSENNLPGWQGTMDGQAVTLHTVNSVFMGIFVPAGKHEVELNYNFPL
jgi:hypothetical protein